MTKRIVITLLAVAIGLFAFSTLRKREPKVLWQQSLSANWPGPPAIGDDGTIYFGDVHSNFCAVTRDGALRWKSPLTNLAAGFRFLHAPAIGTNKVIYVPTSVGELFAIGPDGRIRWSVNIGVSHMTTAAIGAGNVIYLGTTNNTLHAFNADGSPRWHFKTEGQNSGNPVVGPDGTIYFGCSYTNLYALNPNGNLKWKFTNGLRFPDEPIVGVAGTLYVQGWPEFRAIRNDGTVRWSLTNYAQRQSKILKASGTLYMCATSGVVAVEAKTGRTLWTHHSADLYLTLGLALGSDGMIYFAGDRTIYAIDRNGKLKWTFRRDPNPDPEKVGLLHRVFRPKIGKQTFPCAFTLAEDARLYAMMPDRKLYALQVSAGLATNAPWPTFKRDVRHSGAALDAQPE